MYVSWITLFMLRYFNFKLSYGEEYSPAGVTYFILSGSPAGNITREMIDSRGNKIAWFNTAPDIAALFHLSATIIQNTRLQGNSLRK